MERGRNRPRLQGAASDAVVQVRLINPGPIDMEPTRQMTAPRSGGAPQEVIWGCWSFLLWIFLDNRMRTSSK
jgi:hypothetical protein